MTPDDIDAVLPRVATWPPKFYDLTDPDERAEAVAWLYGLLRAEPGSVGTVGVDEAEIATWAPPKPGTHESDLEPDVFAYWQGESWRTGDRNSQGQTPGGYHEWISAQRWSREHA